MIKKFKHWWKQFWCSHTRWLPKGKAIDNEFCFYEQQRCPNCGKIKETFLVR